MLRDAPPRRNQKRAFSTLPNCSLSFVKLLTGWQTTHYFYDSYLNRVNPPILQNYIRFLHNNLRGIGLLRGLDNFSAKPRFCTNLGAVHISRVPGGPALIIVEGALDRECS